MTLLCPCAKCGGELTEVQNSNPASETVKIYFCKCCGAIKKVGKERK